ncbi:hypothetical protein [Saccharopolyspora sp. NPDC002686]|uniref:hypothetical protein n=1 Tax=Saccharopolyspora sp. NPDC002686 TaxID=3154541 RepID=UPI00331683E5
MEVPEIGPAWLVTRYDDVRKVLSDNRFGVEPPGRAGSNDSLFQDPPGHTRLRSLVSKAFTPRYLAGMRARVGEIAASLLADMSRRAGPVDLVEALAIPLPLAVIGELLGIAEVERDAFRDRVDAVVTMDLMSPEAVRRGRSCRTTCLVWSLRSRRTPARTCSAL